MSRNINVRLSNGLSLSDPFIIASSHLTATKSALEQISKIKPSAVTLKTISQKVGGNKLEPDLPDQPRTLKEIKNWNQTYLGMYSDGAKKKEFLGLSAAHDLLQMAKSMMVDTKIGISILQGENYSEVKSKIGSGYHYVELNLKYSLRFTDIQKKDIKTSVQDVVKDCENFCSAFSGVPKFIKFSREMDFFFSEIINNDFCQLLKENSVIAVVANSKKMIAPPSFSGFKYPNDLTGGVVVGDYLYLDTFNMINRIKGAFNQGNEIEICANGGIISIGEVLDCISLGIKSFQICTLIHQRGVFSIEMLRRQLRAVLKKLGYDNLNELTAGLVDNVKQLEQTRELFCSKDEITDMIVNKGLNTISQCISDEIRADFITKKTAAQKVKVQKISLLATSGSSLSYALANYLIASDMTYETASLSSEEIKSSECDAVIISDAYKAPFCASHPGWIPTMIGNSKYCLMGISEKVTDISRIFMFKSHSAERAKIEMQSLGDFSFIIVTPAELAPLLIGWEEDMGILVKRPLADFYSYLMPEKLANKWTALHSCDSPLWLICPPEINGKVVNDINKLLNKISVNSSVAAKNMLNWGYGKIFSDLLLLN